jgi:hypothetical protein
MPLQGSCRAKLVFTLHQTAVITACRDVVKSNVARHGAKQWDAYSDQHWHPCDHESVNASGREETQDGDAAIYICMFEGARLELGDNLPRLARHMLDHPFLDGREIERPTAEHDHRLLAVECEVAELQHDLEGPAADHDDIDAGKEFREPVRLLLTGVQEVERVVWASQKTIDAYAAKS